MPLETKFGFAWIQNLLYGSGFNGRVIVKTSTNSLNPTGFFRFNGSLLSFMLVSTYFPERLEVSGAYSSVG